MPWAARGPWAPVAGRTQLVAFPASFSYVGGRTEWGALSEKLEKFIYNYKAHRRGFEVRDWRVKWSHQRHQRPAASPSFLGPSTCVDYRLPSKRRAFYLIFTVAVVLFPSTTAYHAYSSIIQIRYTYDHSKLIFGNPVGSRVILNLPKKTGSPLYP